MVKLWNEKANEADIQLDDQVEISNLISHHFQRNDGRLDISANSTTMTSVKILNKSGVVTGIIEAIDG